MEQFQNLIGPNFHEMTKGINMTSVFSLAKSKPTNKTATSGDEEVSFNKISESNEIIQEEEFSLTKRAKLDFVEQPKQELSPKETNN